MSAVEAPAHAPGNGPGKKGPSTAAQSTSRPPTSAVAKSAATGSSESPQSKALTQLVQAIVQKQMKDLEDRLIDRMHELFAEGVGDIVSERVAAISEHEKAQLIQEFQRIVRETLTPKTT